MKTRCSVAGCPTRGNVDDTGTCSCHGTKRRRCRIDGCANGVVQGGVCVKHGAKRRICKYPGCEKNTKSHGLCSKHGPARKKCSAPRCSNVAVRGGKCKSHGAYAAECSVSICSKQAVSGGLCIRHFKEMNEAVRLAQMRHMGQLQAAQGVQGVQVRVAGLAAMNPAMNPTAVPTGLMPLQMQGMGMPMSLPFLSAQSGMTNQMIMPMSNRMGMQMAIPSQIQMVHGLTAGMGVQVHPVTNSKDDADLSKKTSSHGQDANIPLGRSYSSKKDHE